ncbi:MAG: DUF2505 domain-containing protein [Actinomycetota bacterium]
MEFIDVIQYPAHPKQVFTMLTDSSFVAHVCRSTGAIEHTADVSSPSATGEITITTVRILPADELPDFVRRFAGSTLTVRRVDAWHAPHHAEDRRGTVTVEIVGAPIKLTGALELKADGTKTRETLSGELKASVPLLGRKIEEAAQKPIRMAIAKEQEVGRSWLSNAHELG